MNEIEKHVTSLELSKRLKELGFPQRSYFDWVKENGELTIWNPTQVSDYVTGNQEFLCSAYLSSELGDMLPTIEQYNLKQERLADNIWYVTYEAFKYNARYGDYIGELCGKTEADIRARMLIWLVENNYLDPKSL